MSGFSRTLVEHRAVVSGFSRTVDAMKTISIGETRFRIVASEREGRWLARAERAYHRTIAGSAFASPIEGPSAIELQKESLNAVEAARVRLDEIRAQRPEQGPSVPGQGR